MKTHNLLTAVSGYLAPSTIPKAPQKQSSIKAKPFCGFCSGRETNEMDTPQLSGRLFRLLWAIINGTLQLICCSEVNRSLRLHSSDVCFYTSPVAATRGKIFEHQVSSFDHHLPPTGIRLGKAESSAGWNALWCHTCHTTAQHDDAELIGPCKAPSQPHKLDALTP